MSILDIDIPISERYLIENGWKCETYEWGTYWIKKIKYMRPRISILSPTYQYQLWFKYTPTTSIIESLMDAKSYKVQDIKELEDIITSTKYKYEHF